MSEQQRAGIDYIGISTAFYCNDGNGNFLLHQRSENARDEKGKWDFGGGQLNFDERVEEGVLREVSEEWGVDGTIQDQLPAHSIKRDIEGEKTHWVVIPFFIKVDILRAKIMEPEKFSRMDTFRLDDLPEPLHTGVRITMDRYLDFFNKYK